jgi:hypothetical protein
VAQILIFVRIIPVLKKLEFDKNYYLLIIKWIIVHID